MFQLIGKTNIDFIGKRYIAFVISAILIVVGIASGIMIFVGKADLGIDFAGGVMIRGSFEKPVEVSDIRDVISEKAGLTDAQITEIQGEEVPENSYLIRSKMPDNAPTDSLLGDRVIAALQEGMPQNKFDIESIDDIGPAVGETLQEKARWAILLSLLGILAYIWIRFDFRFAVAATIATFHDVLAVLGVFFILQKEITLLVVTALLTLAGYSLTDTVVVYDRIRENLKLFRKRSSFKDTINTSINEVLSRTIITSLTSFLVILALLIFGGGVVRDFAWALFLGILVGTYSSMFVASPIIVEWENRAPKRLK
ncbi:MAG: protein translocase subunit SecF [candidate division Zixibacteria bacterium]|nr:protein translocase subunit SecF [candidate division Zixibacteria bacterium]